MVDQRIKEKLNLHNTSIQTGCSFINNCEILLWPAKSSDQQKVYIMDCDMLGMPLDDGKLWVLIVAYVGQWKNSTWCEAYTDVVLSSPEVLISMVDRELKNIYE